MNILNPGIRGGDISPPWFRPNSYSFYCLNEWISGSWPAAVCEEVNSGKFLFIFTPWMNESWPTWGGGHIDWSWPAAQECQEIAKYICFPCVFCNSHPKSGPQAASQIFIFTPNEYEYLPLGARFRANIRSRTPNLYLFLPIEWMNIWSPAGPEPGRGKFSPQRIIFLPCREQRIGIRWSRQCKNKGFNLAICISLIPD